MIRYDRLAVFAVPLLALALGCGGKGESPRAGASGKVTYNGKPVPHGTVSFVSEAGDVETGQIQAGTYTIARAPVGTVKVAVITPTAGAGQQVQMKQKVEGKTAEVTPEGGKAVEVPGKFNNVDTSGLTLTVPAAGSQSLDIDIKGSGK